MTRIALGAAVLLWATVASAGTSVKMNIAPAFDSCDTMSGECVISHDPCTVESECSYGSVSAKSKVSLSDKSQLKVVLKGIVNADGTPASGEYIALVSLIPLLDGTTYGLPIKVAVVDGKGKATVDVSAYTGAGGDTTTFYTSGLLTAPEVPENCPGDNSPDGLASRVSDTDCYSGDLIGFVGVSSGEKTAIKGSIAPVNDVCDAGTCAAHNNACTTNSDCNFGSLSPKSKMSLSGTGELKVSVKDVVDAAGTPASGTYLLALLVAPAPQVFDVLIIEVPVVDGEGKVEADLLSFLGDPGSAALLWASALTTPTPTPGCPSGNTPADITARIDDDDCDDGNAIAAIGVLAEP